MKARDLVEGNAQLWRAATQHAFLDDREACRWIARCERDFWMAYTGRDG